MTWEDIGSNRRTFKVKVRVDSTIAPMTQLTFSAQLFESVQLGAEGGTVAPTCPQPAPNVTLSVV